MCPRPARLAPILHWCCNPAGRAGWAHRGAVPSTGVQPSALLHQQRELGERGGVVMDGRDIGTVVLPNAQLKIFLEGNEQNLSDH